MDRGFVATANVPGYLPMDDDPPVFDTAPEAWEYLANGREGWEDDHPEWPDGSGEYTETVEALRHAAGPDVEYGNPFEDWPLNADGTGVIYGSTPGYEGDHDLGLAYCVTVVDQGTCEANARKGTGTGMCDRVLDLHGQCDRASSHV